MIGFLATTSAGTYVPVRPSATNRQPVADAVRDDEEKEVIRSLKARDREVRSHEAAHSAAGGQYTGSTSYTFQRGPDGVNYAVGGEVSVDTSEVPNDPEATIEKAQAIRAAALAPMQPSTQDRQIAAQALQMEAAARRELQQQRSETSDQQIQRALTGYEAIQSNNANAQSATRLIDYTV